VLLRCGDCGYDVKGVKDSSGVTKGTKGSISYRNDGNKAPACSGKWCESWARGMRSRRSAGETVLKVISSGQQRRGDHSVN